MGRKALGRSLEELLPDLEGKDIFYCPVDDIEPNPYQPRGSISDDELRPLVESIKKSGVLQPVGLKRKGEKYVLVFGERRWRAAKVAGLERIPAIVMDADEKDMLLFALYENLLRKDLNPIEEGESFKRLSEEFGLSHDEIGRLFGKDRSTVTNTIRLLSLPEPVKDMVRDGNLKAGHARALLSLEDEKLILEVAKRIAEKGLSVRETEKLVSSVKGRKESRKRSIDLTERYREPLEKISGNVSGFKVRATGRNLKLEFTFKSSQELERFLQKLQEVFS